MPYGIINLVIDSGNGLPPVQCKVNTRGSVDFLSVWTRSNEFQWNMNQNTKIFIQENVVESVCKKADILLTAQLRLRQNGRHFADDIFKCMSLNEKFWILNKISLKYVPQGLIDRTAVLVQIMAWHRTGNNPLSVIITWLCGFWREITSVLP